MREANIKEKGGSQQERKGKNEKKNRIEKESEKQKERFSQRFDCWSSMVREEKSIHASRATRECQNLGFLSNSTI